jgi:hypothetical protein
MWIASPGCGGFVIEDSIVLRIKYERGIISRTWAGYGQVVLGYVGEEEKVTW